MNFKKIFTKFAIAFLCIGLYTLNSHSAFAAGSIDFICKDLNNQNEAPLQGLLVVINEEPIGGDISDLGGSAIKRCDRVTDCIWIYGDPGKWSCNSSFQDKGSCQNQPRPQLDQEGIPKSNSYSTCDPVQAYVAVSGPDLLFTFITQIYRYAAVTGGVISVLFLIFGGLMITSSGDNSEALGKGKAIVIRSLSGIVLLFLSALILYTVNPNFFTL